MGKPSLTEEAIKHITWALGNGGTLELAAQAVGLDESTVEEMMVVGISDLERGNPETKCAKLVLGARHAVAEVGLDAISTVREAAKDGNLQAAIWLLENRFPQQYGKRVLTAERETEPIKISLAFDEGLKRKGEGDDGKRERGKAS